MQTFNRKKYPYIRKSNFNHLKRRYEISTYSPVHERLDVPPTPVDTVQPPATLHLPPAATMGLPLSTSAAHRTAYGRPMTHRVAPRRPTTPRDAPTSTSTTHHNPSSIFHTVTQRTHGPPPPTPPPARNPHHPCRFVTASVTARHEG